MDLGFIVFDFNRPWYLLLLLMLPVLWYLSYNSLAGLGFWRRWLSLALRTLVLCLVIGALSEMQWQLKTDRLTVLYLLDQSDSVSPTNKQLMLKFAHDQVELHRRSNPNDKAGVIVFGADAKIESAPYDGRLPLGNVIESANRLNTDATSIESALKIAQAAFPEGTARRVVILSDGNENVGDSLAIADAMAESGIGIDVVPVELLAQQDVAVDKVDIPANIRRGQDFEIRVSLTNKTIPSDENPTGEITGQLTITNNVISRNAKDGLLKQQVTLQPGKNLFSFNHKLERSAMYTLQAEFEPDEARADMVPENNVAAAFTQVKGKGKILLIEDGFNRGEFDFLVDQLTRNGIEVEVRPSNNAFQSAADLLQFDSVILANVPRANGEDSDQGDVQSFSDNQIKMMVDNCEHFGCGIVMLGGDRSFGAGGWSNSPLEKAMPVDFQIKNTKVRAVGALALMMHACEFPNGNYWEKQIAKEAIKVLSPLDYCGVIDWSNSSSSPRWLWKFDKKLGGVDRVFGNRKKMLGLVNRMTTGDMFDFNAPMRTMLNGLKRVDASVKHAIIISDGDPTQPTNALLNQFVSAKIKISTCAVGTHGKPGSDVLKKIARVTGGKYYLIKKASALPSIYQAEARRVAKPVIFESKQGIGCIPVSAQANHEILKGIDLSQLPPYYGYVMTTIKNSGLVERLALSSAPNQEGTEENRTLLATWRYGNGRTVCFTSDAGFRWTNAWGDSEIYGKLFSQIVRYSMRPITEAGNFTIASEVRDGKARVTVTALDENDNFLNFLDISGSGVGGDNAVDLDFRQVGPGRYVAEQQLDEKGGNWLFTVFPGKGYRRLVTGVAIPYSQEHSDRESNLSTLTSLASFKPKGGQAGVITDASLSRRNMNELRKFNSFRPTLTAAVSIRDIWPLLVTLCGVAFFADVFVRRVAVSFDWVGGLWRKLMAKFSQEPIQDARPSIARLQSRKAEIEKTIESKRAATKFVPDDEAQQKSGAQHLESVIASEIKKTPAPVPKIQRDESEEEGTSYTSRLLEAKKKARRQQDGDQDR